MADRELIAAILTAGMLPTLEIPRSRLQGRSSRVQLLKPMRYNVRSITPSAYTD
jgi:hypothetical protein